MTSREAMALRAGTWVWLSWLGPSTDELYRRRATVVRVNTTGSKVAVRVHKVCAGEYTGKVGRLVRWFPAEDVIETNGRWP